MGERIRVAGTALLAAALLALPALPVLLLGACAGQDDAGGPQAWVNPDLGSIAQPLTLDADQLPYRGTVTEGVNYVRIEGLSPRMPWYVGVAGMQADADLFVLGNGAFTDYQCSSIQGGPSDESCLTATLPGSPSGSPSGDVLYVEIYGYAGTDTGFVLDVW